MSLLTEFIGQRAIIRFGGGMFSRGHELLATVNAYDGTFVKLTDSTGKSALFNVATVDSAQLPTAVEVEKFLQDAEETERRSVERTPAGAH